MHASSAVLYGSTRSARPISRCSPSPCTAPTCSRRSAGRKEQLRFWRRSRPPAPRCSHPRRAFATASPASSGASRATRRAAIRSAWRRSRRGAIASRAAAAPAGAARDGALPPVPRPRAHLLVRGRFPLASRVNIPAGFDLVALLPATDVCRRAARAGIDRVPPGGTRSVPLAGGLRSASSKASRCRSGSRNLDGFA